MTWSLKRLADAAETVARALTTGAEESAKSAKLMEDMLANQVRMVQQNDETAERSIAMETDGRRHRENCEEYHKKMIAQATEMGEAWRQQFAALETRVIELEKKAKEPWE